MHVWGDNGLLVKNKPKIISPKIDGGDTVWVSDIIDSVFRTWREEVIDNVFYDFEVAIIKNIPLSLHSRGCSDLAIQPRWGVLDQIWIRVFIGSKHPPTTGSINYRFHETIVEKKIWSFEVPNKVKNLVWWACTNSLPTKANLASRKIITDSLCDICRLH